MVHLHSHRMCNYNSPSSIQNQRQLLLHLNNGLHHQTLIITFLTFGIYTDHECLCPDEQVIHIDVKLMHATDILRWHTSLVADSRSVVDLNLFLVA